MGSAGLLKEYSTMLVWVLRLLDAGVVMVAGIFIYWFKFQSFSLEIQYGLLILASALVTPFVFQFFQIYSSIRIQDYLKHFFHLLQAIFGLLLLVSSCIFITKTSDSFSRAWLIGWMFTSAVLSLLLRGSMITILRFMRKKGLNERHVIVCGDMQSCDKIYQGLQTSLWTGFKIVSQVTNLDEKALAEEIRKHDAQEVWLSFPVNSDKKIKDVLYALRHKTVTTRLFLNLPDVRLLNSSVEQIAGLPVVNLRTTPMVGVNRLIKGVEDRLLAVVILMLISPILFFISIGIKLSSKGPIFFRQKRVGWNGKEFEMLKFRSMPINAEDKTGPVWATENENRATKFGALLRKTSLDELPQFINVLKGDMSIVGPRPERLVFVEEFKERIPNYMQKHLVKAGITGWAQINGWRGNTSLKKRIEFDLYYIEHWSLYFDLKIIFLTFLQGFINKNAY